MVIEALTHTSALSFEMMGMTVATGFSLHMIFPSELLHIMVAAGVQEKEVLQGLLKLRL
jgi:hypothetical protein